MFDTNIKESGEEYTTGPGKRPRECCAVFTSSIAAFASSRGIPLGRAIARTAVHELGHLFNLQHPGPGSYFMTQSGSVTNDATGYSRFSDDDRRVLSKVGLPDFEYAYPGTREFGDIPKSHKGVAHG